MTPAPPAWRAFAAALLFAILCTAPLGAALLTPSLDSIDIEANGDVCVVADIPPGFRHALLERYDVPTGQWLPWISGALNGATNQVTFIDDTPAPLRNLYRVTAGEDITVPAAPFGGAPYFTAVYNGATGPITGDPMIGHVLNRIAYGPTPADYSALLTGGVVSYIDTQLDPTSIDESANSALNDRVADLFNDFVPGTGVQFLGDGSPAVYLKGNAAPPSGWMDLNFDDSLWAPTISPVGYGNDFAFADPLDDMREDLTATPVVPGYYSFYMRQEFVIDDPSALSNFFVDMRYDDSFVAYLNGTEVARANITGTPTFNQPSDSGGGNFDNSAVSGAFELTAFVPLLNAAPAKNVLAVEVHNSGLTSSDAGALPVLVDFPTAPYESIRGAQELQQLIHLRGIYSQKQLQAVLGEFWENHFTTDFDKVEDFLMNLDEYRDAANVSQAAEDMLAIQVEAEAARIEWEEYEFFHANALGNFGDLLLYSASSPAMLIYLDSVLNLAAEPNENYPREILELHTFGVDNRYSQTDIEVLARCFTGWSLRKMRPADRPVFPASARTPPITESITVGSESEIVALATGWKYFEGTAEPSPGAGGVPDTAWTLPGFTTTTWTAAPAGFGYADGDDATVLAMQGNYLSVYARNEFTVDPASIENLVLSIDYDDGYVAYLNGTEIARSGTMADAASPPAFDQPTTNGTREAGTPQVVDLGAHIGLLQASPAVNVLAVQGHNGSLSNSSDFSLAPRLLSQTYTPDSIAVTDAAGLWTFRFDPAQHDTGAKTLFPGSPQQIDIPAGRLGVSGVNDAIDVIDAMVSHPSTAEFICLKLVNRFVSDEISLDTYQDRSAPAHLLEVVDNAIAAWGSTTPHGDIGIVMRAVLDLDSLTGAFWREASRANKVKNPVEYINSAFRALGADVARDDLPDRTRELGMELFQRDTPDGYNELGIAWTDTQSLLGRMKFGQGLADNQTYSRGSWDVSTWLASYSLGDAQLVLDHFEAVLFQGDLPTERRTVLEEFINTDKFGAASAYDSLSGSARVQRIADTVGLVLALPEFQFQ